MTSHDVIDEGVASKSWEFEALTRLDEVTHGFRRSGSYFDSCLSAILDAAIFVTVADKGKLQLIDPVSGCLVVRAQRGFQQPLLEYYAYVHEGSDVTCGAALRKSERVIVEDVATSDILSGKPAREVLLEAGVRAVQSTPLRSRAGRVVGMLCTHFTRPHQLRERELAFMDVLARRAADYVEGAIPRSAA